MNEAAATRRSPGWLTALVATAMSVSCASANPESEPSADGHEDEQTMTTDEALADGCWNFDKGAIGGGLRYLRFTDFGWGGHTQRVYAVRIDNDSPHVLGYRVSLPRSPRLSTAEFAQRDSDTKIAINGDFIRNDGTGTWGLWKSHDAVYSHDTGHPFFAFDERGADAAHPDRVPVSWKGVHPPLAQPDTPGRAALSGYPMLVKEGNVVAPSDCPNLLDLCSGRHPRTATGLSETGRYMYLVVFEGRKETAAGVTMVELGQFMKKKICAASAENQDGGGSSTLWIRGQGVVNDCSDGVCRHLINHLGVRWSAN